jgi:multidrug efflux pump
MSSFIDLLIGRSKPILLIIAIIVIAGVIAYINIPKEDKPDIQIPFIGVTLDLRGISPEDAERLLLKPMEKELKSVDNVKKMVSYARFGGGEIQLEFDAGFDSTKALQDIRDKVNSAKSELPNDTSEPNVYEINLSQMPVVTVLLSGGLPEKKLVSISRDLKDKITQLKNVLKAKVVGDRDEVIEIIIDPLTVNSYSLSLEKIFDLFGRNNQLIAAGSLSNKDGSFSIKIPSVIENVEDVLNMPVKADGDQVIRIKDIAKIKQTLKEPDSFVRVNGKPAIGIQVSKRVGANIIETVAKIKKITNEEKQYWPKNIQIIYSQDISDDIADSLRNLENNIILAIMLSLIPIILSMGLRSALLISFSVPVSFLMGILILKLLGFSMNIVVTFSLILSIGMLIDASIVVCEYADRKMLQGYTPSAAFAAAVKRMWSPVYIATATTLIVFMPLFFWPGVLGQFMFYMPVTIVATVGSSLLVAFIFIPVIGSMFGKTEKLSKTKISSVEAADTGDLKHLSGFTKIYAKLLERALKIPGTFAAIIFLTLFAVIVFFAMFGTGMEFFPKIEPKVAQIIINSRGNLSIWEKNKISKKVEKEVFKFEDEVNIVFTTAGHKFTSTETIAKISIEFVNWRGRRKATEILDDIRRSLEKFYGLNIEVLETREGPSGDKPVHLEVSSRFSELIEPTANRILKYMKQIGGFSEIETSINAPELEWELEIDREKAARFGADMALVGKFVQMATNGLKITSYRPDHVDEEVDILIRFPKKHRTLKQIDNMMITTKVGPVAINNFVTRKARTKVQTIKRVDGIRSITIDANVASGYLVDTQLTELRTVILNETLDPRVSIKFGGESEDQDETKSFLSIAFIIALLAMYVLMLLQFNNYYYTTIIMTAVFLSTTGVLLGLFATGQPFGIVMCGVGTIALAGTVVNNNIIFIDTYKQLIGEGMDIKEALIRTGVQRLRPILLTAGTGVLGLLPMVLGISISLISRQVDIDAPASQWWRQLSTTIAGGLAFATILTLFFTPALLIAGENFNNYLKSLNLKKKT